MKAKVFISEEKKKDICHKYLEENWTIKLLTEKYALSRFVVKKILQENQIPIKRHTKRSRLFMKEDYFEKIDTEAKAYFLGLLFTDGNIFIGKKEMNQIALELTVRDVEILEKLKQELNTNNKITYRKNPNRSETVSLKVFSKKMVEDLSKYGVIPQKTKKTKHLPLDLIPNGFKKDFVRGLIDGDGSVFYHGKDKSLLGVTFCSYNRSICEELKKICDSFIGIETNHKVYTEKNKNISRVTYTKQDVTKQLVTVLYKDSNYYLTRKYNLAKIVFESKDEEDIV